MLEKFLQCWFLCLFFQLKSIESFSWGLNLQPSCVPVNLLCAYTEECCAGVCVQRVYFRILKIKQCTLGNFLNGLPPESQLNYFQTAAQAKNFTRMRERLELLQEHRELYPDSLAELPELAFEQNLRPEVKEVLQKEKSTLDHGIKDDNSNFLNIYKAVSTPILTTVRPKDDLTKEDPLKNDLQEDASKVASTLDLAQMMIHNQSFDRVSKSSRMYGGPLNLTTILRMPADKIHKTLLKQSEDK
ncbi:hypothetical protein J6590_046611 [Homalodisca vitripennis]|nr:hypothetical protein J6590_046611 [Homalodisca vitripennis]